MKRIVFDTNVTISAFFWKGYPRDVYDLVKQGKIILLSSRKIEVEFIRVLAYSKFGLTPAEILPIVNDLRKFSRLVETKGQINVIKKDLSDNMFLECAIDGKADYIISGDRHLLEIGKYENIQIIKAKDFLIKKKNLE